MDQLRRATALLFRRLRLDLRSVSGHLQRLLGAACLLFTIYAVVESKVPVAAPGLMVYRWIVWVDSLLITIAGVTIFASIIAGEREQRTLSLLRMTGMNSISLLLGQGFSGIVIGCLLLATQFPFVVLTITLGGVVWDQVLATYLALLAHMVLCAGLGLFWSVACARAGSASFYTLLSLFGLWLGPWLIRFAMSGLSNKGWISSATEDAIDTATSWLDERLVWTHLNSVASSFGVTAAVSPQFWWSVGTGLGLLLLAAFLLDCRPLEVPAYSPIVIRLWRVSGSRAWHSLALTGKDYRQFMGGVKGLTARLILYPLVPLTVAWAIMTFGANRMTAEDVATTVFWFGVVFVTVELAAIASRLFRNEVAELTWSSLAILPRWRVRIVAEKLFGSFLGLVPGLIVCFVAGASSTDVQEFLFGPFRNGPDSLARVILLMQPVLWVAVTGLSSMWIVAASPTVTIFCGLVGILAQYFLMLLLGMMFWGPRLSFNKFAKLYLSVSMVLSVFCFLAAFLRLRKLTERN